MYNPEAAIWPEGYFTTLTEEDLDDFLSDAVVPSLMEDDFTDTVAEALLPDDDHQLQQFIQEINRDVSGMSESEVQAYMQDRMGEFWPALLAAALPTVIQMAPQVISAVSSLVSKGATPKAPAPAPTPPSPITTPAPAGTATPPQQTMATFINLLQSPAVQQLLNNLLSGKGNSITTATGQQIGASNVLGVIASLAGSLAGSLASGKESFFPEYIMSAEGKFLIDPYNPVQEAEVILDLINTR